MLDTSVLVAAERRTFAIEPFLATIADEPVGIAAITASELLHGCHRGADPGTRARRFAFVEALLELIPVIDFGIGATALARGYALATLNARDFRRIPGLRLATVEPFIK